MQSSLGSSIRVALDLQCCHAVQAEMARALFWRMKANGQIVIGISSYQEFPGKITNPFDDRHTTEADWEIYKATDGWLHCFRYRRSLPQPVLL